MRSHRRRSLRPRRPHRRNLYAREPGSFDRCLLSSAGSGASTIADRGSDDWRRVAAEYMKESFEAMGIPARILEFAYIGMPGFNVEAVLQGTKGEKHLSLTAHVNSVYNPGADDDASGLTSSLSTARALQGLNPTHTVHYVAYDLK